MTINNIYMIFKNHDEIKENYFTTLGQASCNLYGHICVKNLIDTLKTVLLRYKQNMADIDNAINNKDFKSLEKLEKLDSNIYKTYYDTIFTILTNEEVDQIQKSINYDFMSQTFINKIVELLENKEI